MGAGAQGKIFIGNMSVHAPPRFLDSIVGKRGEDESAFGAEMDAAEGFDLMSESSNPIENTSPEPLGADVEIALPADCVAQIREGVVWIDGDSSRRCRAMLGVRGKKIVAVNERGEECTVSLAKIKISSRLGSAPRQFLFANGTAIMVDDNDAADDLIRQVGGSSLGLHHFEHGQRIVALIVALAMAYWIIIVHAIPAVADFAAHRVSQKHLATISDDVYQHFINAEILSRPNCPKSGNSVFTNCLIVRRHRGAIIFHTKCIFTTWARLMLLPCLLASL